MTRHAPIFALLPLLLLCLAPIAPARAQRAKPASTLTSLVAQLDDADYATRLKATQALMSDDSLDTRVLVQYYEKSTSPEQRHRLIDITLHHVIHHYAVSLNDLTGPGAIGTLLLPALTADQVPDLKKPAVRVGQPRPGFPAYACLLPGDLIVEFGGKPLSTGQASENNLIKLISDVPPGDKVTLGVYRAGIVFTVVVPVFSKKTLLDVYDTPNLSPRTLLPRQWDEFTGANPRLSIDNDAVTPTSPPPIDLTSVLKSVRIWSMPTVAGGSLPINRPPPLPPNKRTGQPRAEEDQADDGDRE